MDPRLVENHKKLITENHKELIEDLTEEKCKNYARFIRDYILPNLDIVCRESKCFDACVYTIYLEVDKEKSGNITKDIIFMCIEEYLVEIDVDSPTFIYVFMLIPSSYKEESEYKLQEYPDENGNIPSRGIECVNELDGTYRVYYRQENGNIIYKNRKIRTFF